MKLLFPSRVLFVSSSVSRQIMGKCLNLAGARFSYSLKGTCLQYNVRRDSARCKGHFVKFQAAVEWKEWFTSPSWAVMGRSFTSKSGTDSPSGIWGDFCTWLKDSTTAEVLHWTPECSKGESSTSTVRLSEYCTNRQPKCTIVSFSFFWKEKRKKNGGLTKCWEVCSR